MAAAFDINSFSPLVEKMGKLKDQVRTNSADSTFFKTKLSEITNSIKDSLSKIKARLEECCKLTQTIADLTKELNDLRAENAKLSKNNTEAVEKGQNKEVEYIKKINELTADLDKAVKELQNMSPSIMFKKELDDLKSIESQMKELSKPCAPDSTTSSSPSSPSPSKDIEMTENYNPIGREPMNDEVFVGGKKSRRRRGKKVKAKARKTKKMRGGWRIKKGKTYKTSS